MEKTFSNLLPFFELRISFRFIKIDSWDSEVLNLLVNGLQVTSSQFLTYDNFLVGNQCGFVFYPEMERVITGRVTSSSVNFANSVIIRIGAQLNSPPDDESWGIADFTLCIK
jgi:hypothetical protein